MKQNIRRSSIEKQLQPKYDIDKFNDMQSQRGAQKGVKKGGILKPESMRMFSLKNIDDRFGQQPSVTSKNIKSTKSIQFRDTSEIFYVINNQQKQNFNECCAIM